MKKIFALLLALSLLASPVFAGGTTSQTDTLTSKSYPAGPCPSC